MGDVRSNERQKKFMRLHLDTSNVASNAAGATGAINGPGAVSPAGRSGDGLSNVGGDSLSFDRVAVSGASRAWASSFSDRSARIQQLTSAVQGGTYQVSSAAVSQSIIASAVV